MQDQSSLYTEKSVSRPSINVLSPDRTVFSKLGSSVVTPNSGQTRSQIVSQSLDLKSPDPGYGVKHVHS